MGLLASLLTGSAFQLHFGIITTELTLKLSPLIAKEGKILGIWIFFFFFFGREACGILVPCPVIKPTLPASEGNVLIARPLGKSWS